MTRRIFIERLRRQIYGDFPPDEAVITDNLVNQWVNDGLALAAKTNYTDSVKLDNIGYVNNAFYSTFKGISVTKDENFIWKITLPEVPVALGRNESISTLQFKDSNGKLSFPVVWLNESQRGYYQTMRPVSNKLLAYNEGEYVYIISTILLDQYTGSVTMVSGGDSTNLDSTIIIPNDYVPIVVEYVKAQLAFEKAQPKDRANDGLDQA